MENKEIMIEFDSYALNGMLTIPKNANSIVIFAHGSGSSRLSSRNQFVAHSLNEANIATLLFDLLTQEEDRLDEVTAQYRFDINLLTERLMFVGEWVSQQSAMQHFHIGYFGASTGAAAALKAAAFQPDLVKAVVSRGGRPDLAGEEALKKVKAPTLLLVGECDEAVIQMNQDAMALMRCEKKLTIIPKATHLFEEPGALEEVARHAKEWFIKYG